MTSSSRPRRSARSPSAAAPRWRIAAARGRCARGRGLLGRPGLGPREGLWLPVRSVHTVGMRFALDLVWLARDGAVLRVDRGVRPGRVRTCLAARGGVVEVAAGGGALLAADLAAADQASRSSGSASSARVREPR